MRFLIHYLSLQWKTRTGMQNLTETLLACGVKHYVLK